MSRRPVGSLRNLGPVSARLLMEVGVRTEDELRELGAVRTWRRLKAHAPRRVTLNFLYALEGALRGVNWTELSAEERAQLRGEALGP